MPRCSISEHSLELNVCCSMVEDLRKALGLQACAFGYTLSHEGILGLDVSVRAPRCETPLSAVQKALEVLGRAPREEVQLPDQRERAA